MSIKLMSQVWEVQSLSQPRKMLLLAIADFANDEGLSWPSVETLMRKCSFKSDSGVRRALDELCKEGWMTKTKRSVRATSGRRVQGSNYYQISISKLQAELSEPAPRAPSKEKPAEPLPGEGSQHEGSPHEPSQHEGSCDIEKQGYEPVPGTPDPSVTNNTDPSVDKNTLCQVAGQPDPEVVITDLAKRVLKHLNAVTGSRWQMGKTSMAPIRGRLGEGFTAEELELTVDYMNAKWSADPDMSDYLRPTTLFKPTKFPGYLKSANSWLSHGRPERRNGKWVNNVAPISNGEVTNTERDAAFARYMASESSDAVGEVEKLVVVYADQGRTKGMTPEGAKTFWNDMWAQCVQIVRSGRAA